MSLRRTLDAMALSVGRASSVPLSASCLVNRAEMLSLIERARSELPAELDEATALLVAHQEVLDAAEREGEQVLDQARGKAEAMVEETVIVASAQARADAILHAARTEATRLLRSADDYCDRRLAVFETDLDAAIGQVRRGRDRLRERSELDNFAQETGLADAADAVDSAQAAAAAAARGQVPDVPEQQGPRDGGFYDNEAAVSDVNDAAGLTGGSTGRAEPDRLIDLTDLTDLTGRTDAEPAGLGQGRSLQ